MNVQLLIEEMKTNTDPKIKEMSERLEFLYNKGKNGQIDEGLFSIEIQDIIDILNMHKLKKQVVNKAVCQRILKELEQLAIKGLTSLI